jgi:hypothetical protein
MVLAGHAELVGIVLAVALLALIVLAPFYGVDSTDGRRKL